MGAIEKLLSIKSPVCDGDHRDPVTSAQIIHAQMQRKMQDITETQSRGRRHRRDMPGRDALLVRHLSDADANALATVPQHGRQGDAPQSTSRGSTHEGGFPMINFRIETARHAATLRSLAFAVAGLLALASTAQADSPHVDVAAPPSIVIDAEFVPSQPVSHVRYVAHEQQLLAMDATSGAIRAVIPAPQRPAPSSFSALAAGSVTVPVFGLALLATVFVAMVGVIFLRRTPANA
jgi:hypothetical protein